MAGADNETDLDQGRDDTWERNLGPDERDRDLMDGSWEARRSGRRNRERDWKNVQLGLALFVLLSLIVPLALTVLR